MSDSYNGFDNKEAIKEIRQISAFFNPQNFADQLAKAKEQQRKKEKEIREIGGKLHKEYIQLWINHSDKDYYDSLSSKNQKLFFDYKKKHSEDYIRISGDEIETTKNVKVSIQDAAILYRMIKAGKDIKGYKIGYYTVISLNGVLHIGCHKINRENMTEIGEQLIK